MAKQTGTSVSTNPGKQTRDPRLETRTSLDRPAVLGDIDAVALDVLDPAFGDRAVGIILGFGICDLFDLFDALDFETEVVDSPRIFFAVDEREIHVAVGEINRPAGPTMFFFHAE